MPAFVLLPAYLLVVTLPLWLSGFGAREPRSLADEVASGAGMLAFSIILVEFVLSGRFRVVSGRIGMDVTMRMHQLLARSALVLAIIHPFLYSAPFALALPYDPTRRLTLSLDMPGLAAGAAALILLVTFVLVAVMRDKSDQRYETWRLVHGVGAVVISALVLVHTLRVGRYSADPVMAWTWVGFFALAVLSLLTVYVFKPLKQTSRPWTVESVTRLARKTWRVCLVPSSHDGLTYRAGEFVWLNVGHSPFSLRENPFSLSSAPGDGQHLEFVIKELGDFTRTLGSIKPGTRAFVDGPHGSLTAEGAHFTGIALIAGGVGIAPMLSILRQLRHERDRRPGILVYGNRTEDQIVCGSELDQLAAEHGTRIVHVLSEPPEDWDGRSGMVTADLVRDVFDDPDQTNWLYLLCGPPAMMEAVEAALISLGVSAGNIRSERFRYD